MEFSLKKTSTDRQDTWFPSPSRHYLSEHSGLSYCSSCDMWEQHMSVHEGSPYRSWPAWVMGGESPRPSLPILPHYTETVQGSHFSTRVQATPEAPHGPYYKDLGSRGAGLGER